MVGRRKGGKEGRKEGTNECMEEWQWDGMGMYRCNDTDVWMCVYIQFII